MVDHGSSMVKHTFPKRNLYSKKILELNLTKYKDEHPFQRVRSETSILRKLIIKVAEYSFDVFESLI